MLFLKDEMWRIERKFQYLSIFYEFYVKICLILFFFCIFAQQKSSLYLFFSSLDLLSTFLVIKSCPENKLYYPNQIRHMNMLMMRDGEKKQVSLPC